MSIPFVGPISRPTAPSVEALPVGVRTLVQ